MTNVATKWVIGNWKMNPASIAEAIRLVQDLQGALNELPDTSPNAHCGVGIAPTFVHLPNVLTTIKSSATASRGLLVGGQDVAVQDGVGAFTGDVSAVQLADLGADFVLIGHSERREYHKEDSAMLHQKIKNAFANDLSVIYCVGESKAQYDAKATLAVLKTQLEILADFSDELTSEQNGTLPKLLIAYEPIWAIGTGLTPTLAEIEAVHQFIRDNLHQMGIHTPILYGGSVNDTNAQSFADSAVIDGALVGGASLQTDKFVPIVKAFLGKHA